MSTDFGLDIGHSAQQSTTAQAKQASLNAIRFPFVAGKLGLPTVWLFFCMYAFCVMSLGSWLNGPSQDAAQKAVSLRQSLSDEHAKNSDLKRTLQATQKALDAARGEITKLEFTHQADLDKIAATQKALAETQSRISDMRRTLQTSEEKDKAAQQENVVLHQKLQAAIDDLGKLKPTASDDALKLAGQERNEVDQKLNAANGSRVESQPSRTAQLERKTVNTTQLNVRSTPNPSDNNNIIGKLNRGTVVSIVQHVNNVWDEVEGVCANGENCRGFVNGTLLTPEENDIPGTWQMNDFCAGVSLPQWQTLPGWGVFAVSKDGHCGFTYGYRDLSSARIAALNECEKRGTDCRLKYEK